jgi:hypothetical protein
MSACLIYDLAPIGSIISWSDDTPRPPARFTKKLAAWETRNSQGRLIRKENQRTVGTYNMPASFTVHQGDLGRGLVVLIKLHRTFSVESTLTFKVIAQPAPGSVRIFDRAGEQRELLHLAEDRAAAQAWLETHRYPNAVLEVVSAGNVCDTSAGAP